jgi:hypothetical protein
MFGNEEHEKVEVTKAYLNARLAEIQTLKDQIATLKNTILRMRIAAGEVVDESF